MTDPTILDHLNPPKRAKEILAIGDLPELLRQCAIWACEFGFEELVPLEPPLTPQKVKDYQMLPESDRKRMNENPGRYSRFWEDHEVRDYFHLRFMNKNHNIHNKECLREMLGYLKPEDKKERTMITNRLKEFEDFKNRQLQTISPEVTALATKFNAQRVDWNEVEG